MDKITTHHEIINPKDLMKDARKGDNAVKKFNMWLALKITMGVGTMACAYIFTLLAISGYKAATRPGGIGIVNWFTEEFLQLVLLSIIMVGQNVIQKQNDTKAEADHQNLLVLLQLQDEQMDELKNQTAILKELSIIKNK